MQCFKSLHKKKHVIVMSVILLLMFHIIFLRKELWEYGWQNHTYLEKLTLFFIFISTSFKKMAFKCLPWYTFPRGKIMTEPQSCFNWTKTLKAWVKTRSSQMLHLTHSEADCSQGKLGKNWNKDFLDEGKKLCRALFLEPEWAGH